MKAILHRRFIIPSLIVLTILIVGMALVAPPDKVLGDRVRIVYVHGAIIRVVLTTFVLSGVLGAVYLFTHRSAAFDWSRALQEASLALWFIYLIVSTIATIQTWGGIAWFEPRWTFTLQMTGLAPMAYLAGRVLKNYGIAAALNAIVAAVMLFLLSQARLIIHPIDPIGASGDAAIEFAYFLMLVLWALVGAQVARAMRVVALTQRNLS